jgi:hypothetical protein
VNFGQVVVGAPKTTGLRLIAGSKPVTVVAVRTNDPKHFPATTTCLGQLDPETSCAVTVSFTPLAAGTRRALLSVSFSDRAALTVPLGGEGIEAVIQLEPTSLDFGPVAADMPDSLTKTVSLTNTGSAPLTITTITSSDRQFSVESRCASTVAVGNSCVFEVTFNPSSVRNHSAIITINANGRGQHRLSVVGEGVVG